MDLFIALVPETRLESVSTILWHKKRPKNGGTQTLHLTAQDHPLCWKGDADRLLRCERPAAGWIPTKWQWVLLNSFDSWGNQQRRKKVSRGILLLHGPFHVRSRKIMTILTLPSPICFKFGMYSDCTQKWINFKFQQNPTSSFGDMGPWNFGFWGKMRVNT